MRHAIMAALLLALALPATAATWLKRGRAGATIAAGGGLQPGEWAQTDVTTNSDDTNVLDVSACENIDVFQYADPDEDGTASTITGTLEMCPDTTPTDNGCGTMPGTSAMSSDATLMAQPGIYVRIAAGGTANDDVRWKIKCAMPSAQ